MEAHKKNLLLQMQDMTQSFCVARLGAFLQRLTGSDQLSPQQQAAGSAPTAPPGSANAEFIAAFVDAINYTFIDFHDLLLHGAELLEFTETTHKAVEGDLAMPTMLDRTEQRFAEPLTSLNRRLASICDCDIGLSCNPLAPVHFALALESAAQNLPWNLHTRVVAIKLFDAEVLQHLGTLYADIDQYLDDQSVTLAPLVSASSAQQQALAAESWQADIAVATEVKCGAADADSVAPGMADELAAFNEAVDSNAAQSDDYVSQLFSKLPDEQSLSEELSGLLSSLYLPYLKLAAIDTSFIDAEDHPAMHLLAALSRACELYQKISYDPQKSALLLEMKAVVQRLSEPGEPRRETFAAAAFRFSAALRQHEREISGRSKRRQRQQSGLRYLEGWKRHVSHVIKCKLDQHPVPVPEAVRLFLVGPWKNYMAGQYLNAATHSIEPTQKLALADEILAYVAPTDTAHVVEFTTIASPVRQSMVACAVDEKEIKQFLLQLMYFHRLARSEDREPASAVAE